MNFKRTFLRVIATVLLLMSLGYLYVSTISTEDLLSVTGRLVTCNIELEEGMKYNHRPLYIELANFPHRFRLMDVYKKWFPEVRENIQSGDFIKIYFRTRLQSVLSFGKRYDAYQIEKNGNIVFPLTATKSQGLFSFKATLFLSAVFFGVSFFVKK